VKETLLPGYTATPLTCSAGFGLTAFRGTGTLAFFTCVIFLEDDFLFLAVERLLETYFQVVAETSAL